MNSRQQKLLDQLKECQTPDEGIKIVNQLLPDWLLGIIDDYSDDYRHLRLNWYKICEKIGVTPKKIVVVSQIDFDNKLQKEIGELLTRMGYVIRRADEFIGCPICRKAIPVEGLHGLLVRHNMPVPPQWSDHCRKCQKYELKKK